MEFKLGVHSSLVATSEPWDFSIDKGAQELEQAMCRFMIDQHGIGLAANQIGLIKQVFVMGSYTISGFPAPFAVFNPTILEHSADQVLGNEGCLSYPDLYLSIKRHATIKVQYQDSQSNVIESLMSGLIARCFQHELDHLYGVCFVDKVSTPKLQLAMKKLRKKKQ